MTLDLPKARNFLRNKMYNSTDKLCRESTRTGGNNYYVNSANGLYYIVIQQSDPANALEQLNSAVTQKSNAGKANTTIYSIWANILHPEWNSKMKTKYAFKTAHEEDWGKLKKGKLLNNNATGNTRTIKDDKIDTLCAYITNEMLTYRSTKNTKNLNNAIGVWKTILGKFDNSKGGYVDFRTEYREAYKQGLVRLCSKSFAELRDVGKYQEATGMWDNNLQDPVTGGIYMRYTRIKGKIVRNGGTYPNVESTAAIILGYQ